MCSPELVGYFSSHYFPSISNWQPVFDGTENMQISEGKSGPSELSANYNGSLKNIAYLRDDTVYLSFQKCRTHKC